MYFFLNYKGIKYKKFRICKFLIFHLNQLNDLKFLEKVFNLYLIDNDYS